MIKFDIGWAFNSIFYAESGFGIQILKFSIFSVILEKNEISSKPEILTVYVPVVSMIIIFG